MKASLSCEALKWRAVGIKNEYSSEPCERIRGRETAWERGVETPVCEPEPYMMKKGCVRDRWRQQLVSRRLKKW